MFLKKNHRLLFYGCWLLLSLVQARFTELQDDEAYYWVYSHFLAWGYFDHPPMIALLVKAGYSIFHNELGVRLFPVILNVLSIYIIERLTDRQKPFLFYSIVLSIAVLQISGFVAVPDIPLIFFTALFFLLYRRFIERQSSINAILLALSIAFLFYSKYHAILIVLFTLASNWKLITRYQAWLAAILALIFFAPHLLWQYQHDWVSIRYHLFESNVNPYKFSFTTEYILGQLLLAGPLAGFILIPSAFSQKPADLTGRALKFTMVGIYAFFLLSSFRGKVEANWTSPCLVPLIILSYQWISVHPSWTKWLMRLVPATLVLVTAARVFMIVDLLPVKAVRERYHSWSGWPAELKKRTKGLPVVFVNSYQRASKYWFYTGQETYSQNWYRERMNNYNLWPVENDLFGKPVYELDKFRLERFPDSLNTAIGYIGYKLKPVFLSFAKVQLIADTVSTEGNQLLISGAVDIPPAYSDYLRSHAIANDTIQAAAFTKKGAWLSDHITPLRLNSLAADRHFRVLLPLPLEKGDYYIRFAIYTGEEVATHNSRKIFFKVN